MEQKNIGRFIQTLIKENQESKKTGRIQYIIGAVFVIITLVMVGLIFGPNPAWDIDLPSFLLLACGCAAVMLLSGPGRGRYGTVQVLRKSVIPLGALIAFLSLIAMLNNMDSPEKIGPNLAVSMLVIGYSLMAYLVFFVLEQHWKADT